MKAAALLFLPALVLGQSWQVWTCHSGSETLTTAAPTQATLSTIFNTTATFSVLPTQLVGNETTTLFSNPPASALSNVAQAFNTTSSEVGIATSVQGTSACFSSAAQGSCTVSGPVSPISAAASTIYTAALIGIGVPSTTGVSLLSNSGPTLRTTASQSLAVATGAASQYLTPGSSILWQFSLKSSQKLATAALLMMFVPTIQAI